MLNIKQDDFDAVVAMIRAEGTRVVMPDEPDRAVIVDILMLSHVIAPGWSRSQTADDVSVSFPRLPEPIPALLEIAGKAVDTVTTLGGDGVRAIARLTRTPLICIAPRVVATRDVFVLLHERQHRLQSDASGFVHALKYAVIPEYRTLAAEGPAYACDMAREVWHEHSDPEKVADELANGLRAYGAGEELVGDVRRQLGVHARTIAGGVCPPVQSLLDGVRLLSSRGVSGLPKLPG